MDKVVRMVAVGGVDQLVLADVAARPPRPGEVRIRHEAIGVNFIDVYQRLGLYPLSLPAVPGVEGAGLVEAIGNGVTAFAIGQRVAYAGSPGGAYATARALPASQLVALPDAISSRLAAASMLKGLTAHMLLTRTYPVDAGATLLIQAAAGGLGTLLTRWAKHLGATVIGTAGSPAKARIAAGHGADHVIVGRQADLTTEVAALTEGRGVDFAIDGVGGDMLRKTLTCVRRFGVVASMGQAAGPIPPLALEELGPARALSLARPSVMAYAADPELYARGMRELLALMQTGITADIGADYPLAEAARAQADLEAGRTTGSVVLTPSPLP